MINQFRNLLPYSKTCVQGAGFMMVFGWFYNMSTLVGLFYTKAFNLVTQ